MEKQRGISVTSSVMKFNYDGYEINLLDTPGHNDFSEDTYRVLTAVDSVLMVIDSVKGVESQTKKLLEVCRLRHTPIMTFINKLDREGREPLDLLDDIESNLQIQCAPMTWPIGMGKRFRGTYHLYTKEVTFFDPEADRGVGEIITVKGLDDPRLDELLGSQVEELRNDVELLEGAAHPFDQEAYLAGLPDAGLLRQRHQYLRRAAAARHLCRACPGAAPPRDGHAARSPPMRSPLPASSSRSRRTWTRPTATGSPSSASAPASSPAA